MNLVDIILQSGEFLYGLVATLLLGTLQLAMALTHVSREAKQSQKLLSSSPSLVASQPVELEEGSFLSEGLRLIRSSVGELVQQELDELRRSWRSRLQRRVATALVMSDVAGGIGLLGTVWGMYMTFFTGAVDKTTILTGMGVALSTTLVGLAISIFLTLFANVVEGRIGAFEEKASLWLLEAKQSLMGSSRSYNGSNLEREKQTLEAALEKKK